MGIRFVNPDTAQVNYGYAQISTTGPTTGFPASVVRWVYNEAGADIVIP